MNILGNICIIGKSCIIWRWDLLLYQQICLARGVWYTSMDDAPGWLGWSTRSTGTRGTTFQICGNFEMQWRSGIERPSTKKTTMLEWEYPLIFTDIGHYKKPVWRFIIIMSLKKRLGWRDLQCYEQFLNYSREAPVSFRRSGGMHVVMHLQPGSAQSEHSCAVHKFNQHGLSMLRGGCNTVSWKTEKRWFDGFPHCHGYHEEDLWQPGPAISNLGLGCHKDVFDFHFIRHLTTFALLIWLHHILSMVQGERYWR